MVAYYRDRAKEYETIYSKPERQHDLLIASGILQDFFRGKQVIELACGTGYWTEKISRTAKSVVATDINQAVIEIAKTKNYFPAVVHFQREDFFSMPENHNHESLFGGFVWSHILLQDLEDFIGKVTSLVIPGGILVFMDNNFVEGSSLPVTETDIFGNTYQERKLGDGSKHTVVKNFPSATFLKLALAERATDIRVINLEYY
jgi:SAM-dependent methyltransferase